MQINENRFKSILMQINENRFISLYTYQSKVTFWYGYCLVDETYLVEIVKYIFFTFFYFLRHLRVFTLTSQGSTRTTKCQRKTNIMDLNFF